MCTEMYSIFKHIQICTMKLFYFTYFSSYSIQLIYFIRLIFYHGFSRSIGDIDINIYIIYIIYIGIY